MKTVFWNPSTFHPEGCLPLRLLIHAQSARYLMDRVVKKVAHNGGEPAQLKMEYLNDAIGWRQSQSIMGKLIESGDVKRVGQYRNGLQSFGYLPGHRYLNDKLRPFHPTDTRLLQRLAKIHEKIAEEQQGYRLPIHDKWEQWQHGLHIDVRQARKAIAELPRASNPYDIQSMMVEQIRQRRHRFIVDAYGRIHNSITSLCRSIRPALRMEGYPLAGVDIVNSQPALLAWHLANLPPQRGKQAGIINGRDAPGPPPLLPCASFSQPPPLGTPLFCSLASTGRLYESLMDRTGLDRDVVKKSLMQDVLGSRYPYPSPVGDAFRSAFPEVAGFILRFNRRDHGDLLRHLQRAESDLVVGRVGRRLAGGCVSLHDSVYSRGDLLAVVRDAFQGAFAESGLRLALKAA